MIVLDTSVLYALADARDRWHERSAGWYGAARDEFTTTPLVLAETDFLLHSRFGGRGTRDFRRDVAAGAYAVEWWTDAARDSIVIADRYADTGLSLTDASLVALAARHGTNEIATLDERHFRAVRPLTRDSAFRLLPIDA